MSWEPKRGCRAEGAGTPPEAEEKGVSSGKGKQEAVWVTGDALCKGAAQSTDTD